MLNRTEPRAAPEHLDDAMRDQRDVDERDDGGHDDLFTTRGFQFRMPANSSWLMPPSPQK